MHNRLIMYLNLRYFLINLLVLSVHGELQNRDKHTFSWIFNKKVRLKRNVEPKGQINILGGPAEHPKYICAVF